MTGPYKPSDFDDGITDGELENLPFCNSDIKGKRKDQVRIFADIANALFEKYYQERLAAELEKAPRVYGCANKYSPAMFTWETYQTAGHHTHTARLMGIKELGKAK